MILVFCGFTLVSFCVRTICILCLLHAHSFPSLGVEEWMGIQMNGQGYSKWAYFTGKPKIRQTILVDEY